MKVMTKFKSALIVYCISSGQPEMPGVKICQTSARSLQLYHRWLRFNRNEWSFSVALSFRSFPVSASTHLIRSVSSCSVSALACSYTWILLTKLVRASMKNRHVFSTRTRPSVMANSKIKKHWGKTSRNNLMMSKSIIKLCRLWKGKKLT